MPTWIHVEPPAHSCDLPSWGFTAVDVHPDRHGAGSILRCDCGKQWRLTWTTEETATWTPYQPVDPTPAQIEAEKTALGMSVCLDLDCELSWKHYKRDCRGS